MDFREGLELKVLATRVPICKKCKKPGHGSAHHYPKRAKTLVVDHVIDSANCRVTVKGAFRRLGRGQFKLPIRGRLRLSPDFSMAGMLYTASEHYEVEILEAGNGG